MLRALPRRARATQVKMQFACHPTFWQKPEVVVFSGFPQTLLVLSCLVAWREKGRVEGHIDGAAAHPLHPYTPIYTRHTRHSLGGEGGVDVAMGCTSAPVAPKKQKDKTTKTGAAAPRTCPAGLVAAFGGGFAAGLRGCRPLKAKVRKPSTPPQKLW